MKLFSHLILLVLFFLITFPAYAMTTRGGEAVSVNKDEMVSGILFAGGNAVTIDGTVAGDVFCGGQNVVISGTVDGDVICGAQTVRIAGIVTGDLRVAAQTIDITGEVDGNVTGVGQSLTVASDATVGGELIFAGQQVVHNGTIALDATVYAQSFVSGEGATVSGELQFIKAEEKEVKPVPVKPVSLGGSSLRLVGKIILYIVLALVITAIAPAWSKRVLEAMQKAPGSTMLRGLLIMILAPIVIFVLLVTIIGIPLGVLLGLAFGLAIVLSQLFAAMYVGRAIVTNVFSRKETMVTNILVGVPVTWLVFSIPVVGMLASALAVLWGMGAMKSPAKAKK